MDERGLLILTMREQAHIQAWSEYARELMRCGHQEEALRAIHELEGHVNEYRKVVEHLIQLHK